MEVKKRPGMHTPKRTSKVAKDTSQSHQLNTDLSELEQISKATRARGDMNKEITELVPEIKQAIQIIVSSVVNPNDFSTVEINPSVDNLYNLPDKAVASLRALAEDGIIKYNLEKELPDMVETAMFDDGAYVEVIMPRHKITDLITDTTATLGKSMRDLESFKATTKLESIGIIDVDCTTIITELPNGNPEGASLSNLSVKFNGNPYSLALPSIYDTALKSTMGNLLYGRGNDAESITDDVLDVYANFKDLRKKDSMVVTTADKLVDDDIPFRLKVPSAAVIPLYTDNKSNHLGYFILTDEMNKAITTVPTEQEVTSSINSNTSTSSGVVKTLLNKASVNIGKTLTDDVLLSDMLEVAGSILINTINQATEKSVYMSNAHIEYENSLLRIILSRALKGRLTTLLFIPSEYVWYLAFDYRLNGTGKSLLEDITLLASFKAMLLLSQVHATIDNHIKVRDVVVDIDDNDPEPDKTREMVHKLIIQANSGRVVWGETSMEKLGSWIQNSGYRIIWNHKTYPDTKVTIDTKNKESSYEVDSTTSDKISNYILRGLGLTPTILEEANNIEFASVANISNSLTNKINNGRQDILNDKLSELGRKLIITDGNMLSRLYDIVDSNSTEILATINKGHTGKKTTTLSNEVKTLIARDLVECISYRVPRAEAPDVDISRAKFKEYIDAVDDFITVLQSTSILDKVITDSTATVDEIYGNLKLTCVLDWCEEKNYMPMLTKLLSGSKDEDLKDVLSRVRQKNATMIKLAKRINSDIDKNINKNNKDDASYEADDDGMVTNVEDNDDGDIDDNGIDSGTDGASDADIGDVDGSIGETSESEESVDEVVTDDADAMMDESTVEDEELK